MSFSEGLKYEEGARKKIIREWAEENDDNSECNKMDDFDTDINLDSD